MKESDQSACPKCGAALPAAATAGLCPRCLMGEAMLATQVDAEATGTVKILTPGELAPHFPQLEIIECLGRGGMGVVYKAKQKSLNRFVALKLLAPERVGEAKFAERFTREAQALAALNHPNIVTVYDFGQAGGFYFLLMEYVDGANLRQLLRARKFTPEEALVIVPPLCDALQFAHDRGIVHRDIKPENLLLDREGRVKVADFGIAKMLGDGDDAPSALGTPGYSAPEQKSNPQTADSRADIYSLGAVFYELLTGELPGSRLEPPSKKVRIDVRLDEVVLRALEQKPELRFQQASEMKTQVETISSRASTAEKSARQWPLKIVAGIFILTGIFGAWLAGENDRHYWLLGFITSFPLAVGIGLLRRRRWWRRAALAMTGILFFFGLCYLIGVQGNFEAHVNAGKSSSSVAVKTTEAPLPTAALLAWIWTLLLLAAMIWILIRARRLCQARGFDRPWLEWIALPLALLIGFSVSAIVHPTFIGPDNPDAESDFEYWYSGVEGGGVVDIDHSSPASGHSDFRIGITNASFPTNHADMRCESFHVEGGGLYTLSFFYKLPDAVKDGDNIGLNFRFFDKAGKFIDQEVVQVGTETHDSAMKNYKKFNLPGVLAPANAAEADLWLTANIEEHWTSGYAQLDDFAVAMDTGPKPAKVLAGVGSVTALIIILIWAFRRAP